MKHFVRPGLRRLKFPVGLAIAWLQIFPCFSWAFSSSLPGDNPSHSVQIKNLIIPDTLARPFQRYDSGPRRVIHIQDLHCDYAVQKKIAELLDRISRVFPLRVVCLEGAAGVLNLDFFKAYPNPRLRKEAAEVFLRKGKISGAEYFAITSDTRVELAGVEDPGLYAAEKTALDKFMNEENYGICQDLQTLLRSARRRLEGTRLEAEAERRLAGARLLEKMLSISCTPAEVRTFQSEFFPDDDFRFLKRLGFSGADGVDWEKLTEIRHETLSFYELSHQRSREFTGLLEAQFDRTQSNVAVLITGGFHSEEILQRLRQRHIGYLSLQPVRPAEVSANPYFQLLSGRPTLLERCLFPEPGQMQIWTRFPTREQGTDRANWPKRARIFFLEAGIVYSVLEKYAAGKREAEGLPVSLPGGIKAAAWVGTPDILGKKSPASLLETYQAGAGREIRICRVSDAAPALISKSSGNRISYSRPAKRLVFPIWHWIGDRLARSIWKLETRLGRKTPGELPDFAARYVQWMNWADGFLFPLLELAAIPGLILGLQTWLPLPLAMGVGASAVALGHGWPGAMNGKIRASWKGWRQSWPEFWGRFFFTGIIAAAAMETVRFFDSWLLPIPTPWLAGAGLYGAKVVWIYVIAYLLHSWHNLRARPARRSVFFHLTQPLAAWLDFWTGREEKAGAETVFFMEGNQSPRTVRIQYADLRADSLLHRLWSRRVKPRETLYSQACGLWPPTYLGVIGPSGPLQQEFIKEVVLSGKFWKENLAGHLLFRFDEISAQVFRNADSKSDPGLDRLAGQILEAAKRNVETRNAVARRQEANWEILRKDEFFRNCFSAEEFGGAPEKGVVALARDSAQEPWVAAYGGHDSRELEELVGEISQRRSAWRPETGKILFRIFPGGIRVITEKHPSAVETRLLESARGFLSIVAFSDLHLADKSWKDNFGPWKERELCRILDWAIDRRCLVISNGDLFELHKTLYGPIRRNYPDLFRRFSKLRRLIVVGGNHDEAIFPKPAPEPGGGLYEHILRDLGPRTEIVRNYFNNRDYFEHGQIADHFNHESAVGRYVAALVGWLEQLGWVNVETLERSFKRYTIPNFEFTERVLALKVLDWYRAQRGSRTEPLGVFLGHSHVAETSLGGVLGRLSLAANQINFFNTGAWSSSGKGRRSGMLRGDVRAESDRAGDSRRDWVWVDADGAVRLLQGAEQIPGMAGFSPPAAEEGKIIGPRRMPPELESLLAWSLAYLALLAGTPFWQAVLMAAGALGIAAFGHPVPSDEGRPKNSGAKAGWFEPAFFQEKSFFARDFFMLEIIAFGFLTFFRSAWHFVLAVVPWQNQVLDLSGIPCGGYAVILLYHLFMYFHPAWLKTKPWKLGIQGLRRMAGWPASEETGALGKLVFKRKDVEMPGLNQVRVRGRKAGSGEPVEVTLSIRRLTEPELWRCGAAEAYFIRQAKELPAAGGFASEDQKCARDIIRHAAELRQNSRDPVQSLGRSDLRGYWVFEQTELRGPPCILEALPAGGAILLSERAVSAKDPGVFRGLLAHELGELARYPHGFLRGAGSQDREDAHQSGRKLTPGEIGFVGRFLGPDLQERISQWMLGRDRVQPRLSLDGLTPPEQFALLRTAHEHRLENYAPAPVLVFFSDVHGEIKKFDRLLQVLLSAASPDGRGIPARFDPDRLLQNQGVDLRAWKGQLRMFNLGDMFSKGRSGLRVLWRIQELTEAGLCESVLGNHDFYAQASLLGVQFPWYGDFDFHGYEDPWGSVELLVRQKREAAAKEGNDELATPAWWARRLRAMVEANQREQKEFQTWLDIPEAGWPAKKDAILLDLAMKFGYPGWGYLLQRVEKQLGKEKFSGNYFYLHAREIIQNRILPLAALRLGEHVKAGEWWWRVFNAISAYPETLEWTALWWPFRTDQGALVLEEVKEFVAERSRETDASPAEPFFHEILNFLRENWSLFVLDPYSMMTGVHAFPPIHPETGEFHLPFQGQVWSGSEVWAWMAEVKPRARALHGSRLERLELLRTLAYWYAHKSIRIPKLTPWINSPERRQTFLLNNGVSGLVSGHNEVKDFIKRLPEQERGDTGGYQLAVPSGAPGFLFTDHGMPGKGGACVVLDQAGLHLLELRGGKPETALSDPGTLSPGPENARVDLMREYFREGREARLAALEREIRDRRLGKLKTVGVYSAVAGLILAGLLADHTPWLAGLPGMVLFADITLAWRESPGEPGSKFWRRFPGGMARAIRAALGKIKNWASDFATRGFGQKRTLKRVFRFAGSA